MKHIMISIKPEWVCKILNKEKLLEIRKSVPKEILNGEECIFEIYCTKDRNNLCIVNQNDSFIYKTTNIKCCHLFGDGYFGNGKVVAEFTLNETDKLAPYWDEYDYWLDDDALEETCLTRKQLWEYGKGKRLYGLHIEDLHIYDQPKELAEFGLKRPPQSWCYIKGER